MDLVSKPRHIQQLSQEVINRIAAGEVVQRPSSALKELLENSIDAGATSIQVVAAEGGLALLQVTDNGQGIAQVDLPLLCERFATSKLEKFNDLTSIETFGFRGEALASISHVGKVAVTTYSKQDEIATRTEYLDGRIVSGPTPCAGNPGTCLRVTDLFYNSPLRKRTLQRASEEYSRIVDVVSKYALAFPKVGFTCKREGQPRSDALFPANSTTTANIKNLFGSAIVTKLQEVSFSASDDAAESPSKLSFNGFCSDVTLVNKKFLFTLFINNRLVDSSAVRKAVEQAYSTLLVGGNKPFVALFIQVAPSEVDVNVHPTKHEVFLLHEEYVTQRVHDVIKVTLSGTRKTDTAGVKPRAKDPELEVKRPIVEDAIGRTVAAPAPCSTVRVDKQRGDMMKFAVPVDRFALLQRGHQVEQGTGGGGVSGSDTRDVILVEEDDDEVQVVSSDVVSGRKREGAINVDEDADPVSRPQIVTPTVALAKSLGNGNPMNISKVIEVVRKDPLPPQKVSVPPSPLPLDNPVTETYPSHILVPDLAGVRGGSEDASEVLPTNPLSDEPQEAQEAATRPAVSLLPPTLAPVVSQVVDEEEEDDDDVIGDFRTAVSRGLRTRDFEKEDLPQHNDGGRRKRDRGAADEVELVETLVVRPGPPQQDPQLTTTSSARVSVGVAKDSKLNHQPPQLTSVQDILRQLQENQHDGLAHVFQEMSYVGIANSNFFLAQSGTTLYLMEIYSLVQSVCFQQCFSNWSRHPRVSYAGVRGKAATSEALPLGLHVETLIRHALHNDNDVALHPVVISHKEKGTLGQLIASLIVRLKKHAPLLEEYFGIVFKEGEGIIPVHQQILDDVTDNAKDVPTTAAPRASKASDLFHRLAASGAGSQKKPEKVAEKDDLPHNGAAKAGNPTTTTCEGMWLCQLPLLLGDGWSPCESSLASFLVRLSADVDYTREEACFRDVATELSYLFADGVVIDPLARSEASVKAEDPAEDAAMRRLSDMIRFNLVPLLTTSQINNSGRSRSGCSFAPPPEFASAGCIKSVVSVEELYKVFERC